LLAILVDLDGTIVNSAPGIIGSYQHALRIMGVGCPPADDLTEMSRKPFAPTGRTLSVTAILWLSANARPAINSYRKAMVSGHCGICGIAWLGKRGR
jgi:phosphoglycolate phosphatase-like HAD superfamily hydrolase